MRTNKRTILIIEDDRSLLRALVDKFKLEGFNVLDSANGKEGLEIALKEEPDLILLDILMPVMDGMTMLGKLRQENQWGKRVPVVILTNVEPNNDMLKIITQHKPAFYLVKSDYKTQEVVDKVRNCLDQISF
jgi:DNA-binding response OmpR family regulator